jgi:hypothetical protein
MTDFMRDELGAPKVVDRATIQAELDTWCFRNLLLLARSHQLRRKHLCPI